MKWIEIEDYKSVSRPHLLEAIDEFIDDGLNIFQDSNNPRIYNFATDNFKFQIDTGIDVELVEDESQVAKISGEIRFIHRDKKIIRNFCLPPYVEIYTVKGKNYADEVAQDSLIEINNFLYALKNNKIYYGSIGKYSALIYPANGVYKVRRNKFLFPDIIIDDLENVLNEGDFTLISYESLKQFAR